MTTTTAEGSQTPEGSRRLGGCACLRWEPGRDEFQNQRVEARDQTSEEKKG